MRLLKIVILIILIFLLFISSVYATFVTDLIAFSKMAIEYSKHLKELKKILASTKKLKDDFNEFKGKFAKIHSGLKRMALDVLLDFKDIEFYFQSPYVLISKDRGWKEVWENTKNLFKKYPYLKDHSVLKKNKLYASSRKYKNRADYRITREESIYSEYEKVLEMILDTRKIISSGEEKYKSVESMIRKFSSQRSTGKLIGLLAEIKLEQLIKLDLLITSVRMKMELVLKEKIIKMDLAKKREIELYEDRKIDKKILNKIL